MSLTTPEEVDSLRPMLQILARRPGAISLRTIYFAITLSKLEELEDVRRFYAHCLGNCSVETCQKESFLKTEFDPYLRRSHEVRTVEFEGTLVEYSPAQYNFFCMFIESGNLAKIVALREKIETEIGRVTEQNKQRKQ